MQMFFVLFFRFDLKQKLFHVVKGCILVEELQFQLCLWLLFSVEAAVVVVKVWTESWLKVYDALRAD